MGSTEIQDRFVTVADLVPGDVTAWGTVLDVERPPGNTGLGIWIIYMDGKPTIYRSAGSLLRVMKGDTDGPNVHGG